MALVPIAVGQECLRAVGCGLMLRGVSSLLSSHCAGAAARVHSSTSPAAAPATSAAATARSSNHLCASGPSGLEAALARGEIAYVMLKGGVVHSVMWDSSLCGKPRQNPLLPSVARLQH